MWHSIIIATVFEKFRNSLKNYRLCSGHYLTKPDLRWGAVLNLNNLGARGRGGGGGGAPGLPSI